MKASLEELYVYAQKKAIEAVDRDNYPLAYIYCQALVTICEKLYPNFRREQSEKEAISNRDNLYLSYDRDRIRANGVLS